MRNSNATYNKPGLSVRIIRFCQKTFLKEKLNNWLGYVLFFAISAGLGYLVAQNTFLGLGFVGLLCGLAILLICIFNAEAGVYICMIYSFFISHFNRLLFHDTLQVGVLSDILVGATFLGFLVRQVHLKKSINEFTQSPIIITLLLVYAYTAIEVFNPNANSLTGWFPAFRKILATLLFLFVSYNVFNSIEKIKKYLKVLFVLCVVAGIYGCIQQFHGFFQFELNWLMEDEKRFRMTFVNGGGRKMSIMPDALSFSIIMAVGSVFFTALATGQKKLQNKIILLTGVFFMLLGMIYSLTRTSNVMLAGGLAMFMLITLDNRTTRIFALIASFIFLLVLYGPYTNSQIAQFRLTFRGGTKDASYLVREENRKSIQPYIYSHPIGGGLSTTGGEGMTYNPGHPLAGFPPDSGYLKKALELGWIGFALMLFLYYLILKTGVRGYFSSKNKETKLLYAVCTAAFFTFYVGDFAQVAIGQITDLVVYYPFIAIILKLKDFDEPFKT